MSPRRLGQHFLKDASWRARILRALPNVPDALWVEIGAGNGEMTRELARHARRLLAIEVDGKLLPGLEALAAELGNVTVVPGDVLALDLAALTGGARFHVYGSLPYYITSPILHRLFEHADRITSINVVVQMEVAVRMAARPGRRDYGYLSAATQFFTRPEIALRLPPGAFRPPPKVASALVRMRLPGLRVDLQIRDESGFLKFVGHCFEQKRKTLLNNLRVYFPTEDVQAALASTGTSPRARAEELELTHFAALYHGLVETPDERR